MNTTSPNDSRPTGGSLHVPPRLLHRMTRVTLVPAILSALLAASTAHAAGRDPIRIQAFVVPYDQPSVGTAGRIGTAVERSLATSEQLSLVSIDGFLGNEPPPHLQPAIERAKGYLEHGRRQLDGQRYSDAAASFERAVLVHHANAAWLDEIPDHGEALALLAAARLLAGDTDGARDSCRDLLLLRPGSKLDAEESPAKLLDLLKEVREEIAESPTGALRVTSRPSGARVYVSGVHRGFTPVRVENLPAGRHMIGLRQSGTVPHGQQVEVQPDEEASYAATLSPTTEFEKLQELVRGVGTEMASGAVGPSMVSLSRTLGLEWVIFGLVRQLDGAFQLTMTVLQVTERRTLASRRVTIPAADVAFDGEIGRLLNMLLRDAAREQSRRRSGGDPLSGRSGTERWSIEADDQPDTERRRRRSRRSRGDPLDERDGTDRW